MLSWGTRLLDALRALAQRPYLPLVLLALLLAVLLFKAVRLWSEIHDVEPPDSPSDLLAAFEQAHAEGELDDAELARVRAQLHSSPAQVTRPEPKAPPHK